MEKAIDLTNQIIKNLESLNNDYLKTIENYENTVSNNTKEIAHLEEEKERIAKDLVLYQEELEKVSKEYQDVEVHISGIKEAGTNLLEANSVEKMLEEARLKKEEIASQITLKEEKAQEEDKEVEAKKVDLANQLESLNNLLPYLKENYSDKLNAFEETLNKLNQEIIDLQKEYQDEALKEVKPEEKETVIEAPIEEVQTEEKQEVVEEIIEPEVNEEAVIEEPVVEEPVVEEKELSDEAQEVEQIKEEIETLDVSAEPQVESLAEDAEVPVLTDNKEEADKVYIEPRIDYSMNPYTKIDQLGLSEQQKSRIMREMSPEKFVQITRVLEDYEIDLKDIADYYDDFLKIEKAANLEDVLGTLRGIGKSNEEQDFSSQLDFIMKANGSTLQDNLLKVYSKGENPKDVNISALTSEYYYEFDQEAENLGIDAKTMRKTHPILVNLMPLDKVVEKTKEDSMTKEKVR